VINLNRSMRRNLKLNAQEVHSQIQLVDSVQGSTKWEVSYTFSQLSACFFLIFRGIFLSERSFLRMTQAGTAFRKCFPLALV
jgi:hypothetical protein